MNKLSTLLLLALAICLASCGGDNSGKATGADTANKPEAEKFEAKTNIRFISPSAIDTLYTLSIETKAKVDKIALEVESTGQYYQNLLQQQQNTIEQKAQQNGFLTEQSYKQALSELYNAQNNYANQFVQKESEAAKQVAALRKTLQDSIQNYLTVYNNEHKYDAILYTDAAAIYNPNLDITNEIVEGLNKRYNPVKPAAEAPETAKK